MGKVDEVHIDVGEMVCDNLVCMGKVEEAHIDVGEMVWL